MSQRTLLQDSSLSKQVELEKMFFTLAEQWRNETGMLSSPTKKLKHPAYQQIISMGEPVLPLILRELERNQDHWFLALIAIAGENPVSPEDDFSQAVAAWLRWGREKGLI